MRITENMKLLNLLRAGAANAERVSNASRRASTGAKVTRPSDDPVGFATAVRRDATIAQLTSRTRTARDAADELTIGETALDSASSLLEEAGSLAVQGSNDTLSQTDRNALAQQVQGLRDQLLELANTRGSNGYLFAGTKTDTTPFDPAGNFMGNDGVVRVPVTDGVAPKANVSGARAFTALGGRDVFADLTALGTALSTGNVAGIRASIDTIRAGHDQVVQAQVEAGLSIERLRSAADVMDSATTSVSASRARALGADDVAGLYTELSAANTAYQQSLDVTRRILALPSLATL
jgi:flagellar hook-associated protein 3 FlgL